MVRKHRVWFPYAMYHITNRGVRKMIIFYDDADYLKYLEILEETRSRYPFLLHAYCLMTNHVHLQLQTINEPIYTIMKFQNSSYAKYFNKKYDLAGHIFQGRYGAELIHSIDYEMDCSKYIHLNPVEANMVNKPEEYRWSSYKTYISKEKNPHVFTDKILSYFPDPKPTNYKKFVEQPDQIPTPPENIKLYVSNPNSD